MREESAVDASANAFRPGVRMLAARFTFPKDRLIDAVLTGRDDADDRDGFAATVRLEDPPSSASSTFGVGRETRSKILAEGIAELDFRHVLSMSALFKEALIRSALGVDAVFLDRGAIIEFSFSDTVFSFPDSGDDEETCREIESLEGLSGLAALHQFLRHRELGGCTHFVSRSRRRTRIQEDSYVFLRSLIVPSYEERWNQDRS